MSLEALNPNQARVTVDFEEAHNLSVGLLQQFHEQGLDTGTASVALIMTVGRLLSPQVLDEDKEVGFLQGALEWIGTYFAEGGLN